MGHDTVVSELCRIVVMVVVSTAMVAGLGTGIAVGVARAPATQSRTTPPAAYGVTQDGNCYEVTPMGDGSTTVSSFYDYSPDYSYSSAGTRQLQDNQVSSLFFYRGARGDSLVFLHDAYDEHGGGALSVTITGLPPSGEWVVEDDSYPGRDDNFNHSRTRSSIDWIWKDGRTDGAAFRGVGATGASGITIDPAFNEHATLWGTQPQPGYHGRIKSWRLLSGGGWTVTTLQMDEPVTIRPGGCDRTPPRAALAVNVTNVSIGRPVTLSASGATDDTGIVRYQWDLDGDGVVEENTTTPTVTTSYRDTGRVQPRVAVVDRAGNADSATTHLSITAETPTMTADRAAAGGLRTTLAHVSGSQCGVWLGQSLRRCVGVAG